MPYPFFIWAALFFLLPALGMAMGLLWAAMFLTLVFAMVLGLAELVKVVARMIPVLREFVPDDEAPQEALARRLEAEEQAARIAAEIEAEIQAARQEAQKTLAPSCPEEAQALQAEAQEELQAARSHLEAAEEAAREQSGGWMQVCEARERLKEAHSRARHAELLLPKQSRSQMRQLLPAARGFSQGPIMGLSRRNPFGPKGSLKGYMGGFWMYVGGSLLKLRKSATFQLSLFLL
ncbi:unnamed protein product [Effrenium voratum]|nr:unnamed protein product [Effrenium voratum]